MFAAILNSDRCPVDLDRLGLTAEDVHIVGHERHVALLRSRDSSPVRDAETSEIENLDGRFWIVGRMRLDARQALAAELSSAQSADARLCLLAYAKWGDAFLDRLAGDFCFVLWDDARGCLMAVRDQLGIRTLYHARAGHTLIVGDTLPWLAAWKELSGTLDDYWIADFLTFGHCQDFDRSVYRDIRRVMPAHVMSVSSAGASIRRYWNLAIPEPLDYRDKRMYGERFRELALAAVADRMPAGRVGITMSGGLDSTTLAACAVDAGRDKAKVIARCVHYESLIPDDEAGLAALVADHLGIELRLTAVDDALYDPQWRTRGIATSEPWAGIVRGGASRATNEAMAAEATVWFEGEGPDNALRFERDAFLSWLVAQRRWKRLAEAVWLYARDKGVHGWGDTLRRYTAPALPEPGEPPLPAWLSPDLVNRLNLKERWQSLAHGMAPRHPWHPRAMASFQDTVWQGIFAECDVDESQASYVWRHPYLDLRVLVFMLSLPPVPWARRKLVMRHAMRGRLPAPILAREKTPLVRDPVKLAMSGHHLPALAAVGRVGQWIDARRLAAAGTAGPDVGQVLAGHALDYWLAERKA